MNHHDPFTEYPPSEQEATATIVPSGILTSKEVDALIAMEMNKMTLEEREKVLDDVHGIPIDEEEDPMQLLTWLDSMDCHLQTIKQQATAYELAKARSREYVQKMRIMFLRSDRYQPKDAAERMARFFELKKRLFGVESLTKDITLDDFDSDDLDTLNCGCVQVSPLTDMAGRQIVLFFQKYKAYKTPENYQRAMFYVAMSLSESEEVQKRGVVAIIDLLDALNSTSVGNVVRNTVPIHFAGFHMLFNNLGEYKRVCVNIPLANTKTQVRIRTHYFSTHLECQRELASFGISEDCIPVTSQGEMSTQHHVAWIKKRQAIESRPAPLHSQSSASTNAQANIQLSPSDVIFGRGKFVWEHPGNVLFRSILDAYMEKYNFCNKLEKTCITEIILKTVQERSGRFLKHSRLNDDWVEVDHDTARRTVAYSFRNLRQRK